MDSIPKRRPLARQKIHPSPRVCVREVTSGFPFELHEEASQHSGGAFLKAIISSEPALKFIVESNEATEESAQGEGGGAGERDHLTPPSHIPRTSRPVSPGESDRASYQHQGKVTKRSTWLLRVGGQLEMFLLKRKGEVIQSTTEVIGNNFMLYSSTELQFSS